MTASVRSKLYWAPAARPLTIPAETVSAWPDDRPIARTQLPSCKASELTPLGLFHMHASGIDRKHDQFGLRVANYALGFHFPSVFIDHHSPRRTGDRLIRCQDQTPRGVHDDTGTALQLI